MPEKRLVTGFTPFAILAWLLAFVSVAEAGSGNVSFSGEVPCRLAAQKCNLDADAQTAMVETASIDYRVKNTSQTARTVRPVVNGGVALSIYPSALKIAPGETARFIVFVALDNNGQTVEICARDAAYRQGGCQRYEAVGVR